MIFHFEEFELDTKAFELRRAGIAIPLERQVYDVLAYLVENGDRVVAKGELLDKIWGDRFVSDAALNSRVMVARKAIGDSGKAQRLIKTVHGRGYRFVGEVSAPDGAAATQARAAVSPIAVVTPGRAEQHIRFVTAKDGVRLAYATVGSGPPLVKAPNWLSHLEYEWRSPVWRHWIEEFSRDHTLVRYDQRGCGLSDWDAADLSWERWVEDLETVVDELGLERFPLLGISQGGSVAIAYSVRHPERVTHLILYGSYVQGWRKRALNADEIAEREAVITLTRSGWGRDNPMYRQIFASSFVPGADIEGMRWFNDLCRVSASPENAERFLRVSGEIDVADLFPKVTAPTIVLHSRGDLRVPFDEGRRTAAAIRGARFVPLDSENHILLEREPSWPRFMAEVRQFLGVPASLEGSAAEDLHTILFTDIEGSTDLTHELGDKAARALFREHERIVRDALRTHGGSEVKTPGDGFMAAFHSATRAIECAVAIQEGITHRDAPTPLKVRIGLNSGETIVEEGDFFGSTVILASRLASRAAGGEILVSEVVRHLVAGKGFEFVDRGSTALKGYPEPVHYYEVQWRRS